MKTEKKWILAPRIPEEIDRTLSGYPTPMRDNSTGDMPRPKLLQITLRRNPLDIPRFAFRDAYGS